LQHFDYIHPENAPEWAYIEQTDMVFDTRTDELEDEEENLYEDEEGLQVGEKLAEDVIDETEVVLIDNQKTSDDDDVIMMNNN